MRPAATIPGRSAIDVWAAEELAATIYCTAGGLHIAMEPGWSASGLSVTARSPHGVTIALERES